MRYAENRSMRSPEKKVLKINSYEEIFTPMSVEITLNFNVAQKKTRREARWMRQKQGPADDPYQSQSIE